MLIPQLSPAFNFSNFVGTSVGVRYFVTANGTITNFSNGVLPGTLPGINNGGFYRVNNGVTDDFVVYVPASGNTINLSYQPNVILNPAAGLATLSLVLPDLRDTNFFGSNYSITISTSQTITALTVTAAAGSVLTPPTTLAAGAAFTVYWSLKDGIYYPSG